MQKHMLQYNPHGKMGSILGHAHMRHAYKLKKHSLAISSVRITQSAELLLAGPISLTPKRV